MNKNQPKIIYERLFPYIPKMEELLIDPDSISYITTPIEAQKICKILTTSIEKYVKFPHEQVIIVDATAGVGGDTIAFSKIFSSVIAIEINQMRSHYLKNNIGVYNIKNVQVINGNSIDILPKIPNMDIIYFDPPWGGKEYKNHNKLRLCINEIQIELLILDIFDNEKMICIPKILVFKLPSNYDYIYLYEVVNIKKEYTILLYELNKFNIITIEKNIISKE